MAGERPVNTPVTARRRVRVANAIVDEATKRAVRREIAGRLILRKMARVDG